MPRLIRHEATGPIKIDPKSVPEGKMIWVCACGLSKTYPICDGAHKLACPAEKPGVLYVYDADRTRVVEERPDEPASGA